jgi:hypothetical protein
MATDTDTAIPAYPGVGGGGVATTARLPIFNDGDPQQRMISIADLRTEMGEAAISIDSITQTVDYDDFTDGGAAVGTLVMTGTVPVGAILIGSKVLVTDGFAGDTSATLTIGDGSDVDRYMTGTPSVFATAATGIQTGVPSGNKLIATANTPTLTVTSGSDWGSVSAGTLAVTIIFVRTVAA